MDLNTAKVIYDNRGYEPGTWYTKDSYHQAQEAYHEAESVLRDAGVIWETTEKNGSWEYYSIGWTPSQEDSHQVRRAISLLYETLNY